MLKMGSNLLLFKIQLSFNVSIFWLFFEINYCCYIILQLAFKLRSFFPKQANSNTIKAHSTSFLIGITDRNVLADFLQLVNICLESNSVNPVSVLLTSPKMLQNISISDVSSWI